MKAVQSLNFKRTAPDSIRRILTLRERTRASARTRPFSDAARATRTWGRPYRLAAVLVRRRTCDCSGRSRRPALRGRSICRLRRRRTFGGEASSFGNRKGHRFVRTRPNTLCSSSWVDSSWTASKQSLGSHRTDSFWFKIDFETFWVFPWVTQVEFQPKFCSKLVFVRMVFSISCNRSISELIATPKKAKVDLQNARQFGELTALATQFHPIGGHFEIGTHRNTAERRPPDRHSQGTTHWALKLFWMTKSLSVKAAIFRLNWLFNDFFLTIDSNH